MFGFSLQKRSGASPPAAVVYVRPVLLIVSALFAVLTVVGVLLTLDHLVSRPVRASALEIFGLIAAFVCGLIAALGLAVTAILLRYAHSVDAALRRLESHVAPPDDAKSAGFAGQSAAMADEMIVLLREMRDNSLLSDEQKRAKLARIASEQRTALANGVKSFLAKGEYHRALSLVDELEKRFGSDTASERMRTQIKTSRDEAERADIEDSTRKVDNLTSINAWPRAEELAAELVDRHPDAPAARGLLSRVQRGRQKADDQHRLAAYADIQGFTSRKEWKQALGSARQFLAKYPKSLEAEALSAQVATLETNAEIHERHELELEIRELVKEKRFAEAVDLAKKIIDRYPDSPQAEALASQLPRLEERALAAAANPA